MRKKIKKKYETKRELDIFMLKIIEFIINDDFSWHTIHKNKEKTENNIIKKLFMKWKTWNNIVESRMDEKLNSWKRKLNRFCVFSFFVFLFLFEWIIWIWAQIYNWINNQKQKKNTVVLFVLLKWFWWWKELKNFVEISWGKIIFLYFSSSDHFFMASVVLKRNKSSLFCKFICLKYEFYINLE